MTTKTMIKISWQNIVNTYNSSPVNWDSEHWFFLCIMYVIQHILQIFSYWVSLKNFLNKSFLRFLSTVLYMYMYIKIWVSWTDYFAFLYRLRKKIFSKDVSLQLFFSLGERTHWINIFKSPFYHGMYFFYFIANFMDIWTNIRSWES